jgi:uncharacterized protein YutE (UPF0331/DUF86 family)
MVDPGRVRDLLETLNAYRQELERLRGLPVDRYVEEARFAGRYLVQAAAQVCIDMASHIVSSEGWRTPTDFRDTFTVLEENSVLAPGLAQRLRELVGLRNRLVHLYGEVDDRLVHEALREGLPDFDAFAESIARLVVDEQ